MEHRSKNREASLRRYGLLVALISPHDQWLGPALSATSSLDDAQLLTTDSVLIEVLNFFAEHGGEARLRAASVVQEILVNPDVEVVRHTHESFLPDLRSTKRAPTKATVLPIASQ